MLCVERGMFWNKLHFLIFVFHQVCGQDYFWHVPFSEPGMSFYNTDIFLHLFKLRIQVLLKAGEGLLPACLARLGFQHAAWRPSLEIFWIKALHLPTGYFVWLMWIKVSTSSSVLTAGTRITRQLPRGHAVFSCPETPSQRFTSLQTSKSSNQSWKAWGGGPGKVK